MPKTKHETRFYQFQKSLTKMMIKYGNDNAKAISVPVWGRPKSIKL